MAAQFVCHLMKLIRIHLDDHRCEQFIYMLIAPATTINIMYKIKL